MSVVTPARSWTRIACALALGVFASGCRPGSAGPSRPLDGRAALTMASELPAGIESISFHLKLYLLDSPSAPYSEQDSDGTHIFLACISGHNQLTLTATIKFTGDTAVYTTQASALFDCRTGLDTDVGITLDIIRVAPIGGGDITVTFGGSQCSSTLALRGDDFLAVCASSSCDSGSSVFLFSNVCRGLDLTATDVWTCGAFTDWTLVGPVARAQYVIPDRDFSAVFGLAAFPKQQLAITDLTLGDATNRRRVFGPIARLFASLSRKSGILTPPALDPDDAADHIALLDVPGTSGAQQVLVEADDTAAGGRAIVWTRLGGCRAPAQGVATWTLHPIDVRLQGLSAIKILLAAAPGGAVISQAVCTVTAGAAGPVATCSPPVPYEATP